MNLQVAISREREHIVAEVSYGMLQVGTHAGLARVATGPELPQRGDSAHWTLEPVEPQGLSEAIRQSTRTIEHRLLEGGHTIGFVTCWGAGKPRIEVTRIEEDGACRVSLHNGNPVTGMVTRAGLPEAVGEIVHWPPDALNEWPDVAAELTQYGYDVLLIHTIPKSTTASSG